MRLDTNPEAMQQLQASILSNPTREVFSDISPLVLRLVDAEDQALQNLIKQSIVHADIRKEEKTLYMLAIAVSHNRLTNPQLKQVSKCLHISHKHLLSLAATWGNIDFFRYLLPSPRSIDFSLLSDLFCTAAGFNHTVILQYLARKNPDKLQMLIEANNYQAFREAAKNGHKTVLKYLAEVAPKKLQKMIAAKDYQAFCWAAENGHKDVLEYLELQTPEKLEDLIAPVHYTGLFYLVQKVYKGFEAAWEYLVPKPATTLEKMIAARDYDPFINAARNGHMDVLDYLANKAADKLHDMIAVGNFLAFGVAAKNGHTEVLKYLANKVPDKLYKMIAASNYFAFREAGYNGHRAVLEFLVEKAPNKLPAMIEAERYFAFRHAAAYGHKAIVEYIANKASGKLHDMISADKFLAFRLAASNGHKVILEYLVQIAPIKLQHMLGSENFWAFRSAAGNGHVAILEYLSLIAPLRLQKMIAARNYDAFGWAAGNGHRAVMDYLVKQAPTKLQDMIAANEYYAFREAALNGHRAILDYLAGEAPDKLEEMITARSSAAFDATARKDKKDGNELIQQWLEFPKVFDYAEKHHQVYGLRYINPFVQKKLDVLKACKAAFEQTTPNGLFNTDTTQEARLLFYVLRNLIRRNEEGLQDDICFLLNIPALKALAHTEVTSGHANELLQMALARNNEFAATRLLELPLVRELAERNNFYREEMRGGLDLAALAQDAESSMLDLTQGEEQRLAATLKRYKPMLNAAGVPNIMQDLKETLELRYSEHPASFILNNQKRIILPLDYQGFLDLNLSKKPMLWGGDNEFKRALKAYYQNPNHTAWRYLSKPNPWMHARALHVNENPLNTNERWSTFEKYASLISLFYLAAIDSTAPPTQGHTFETRLEHFINELAHMGRSHNWDNSRVRQNGGQSIREEYDDLQADRPTCLSGMKRRLFHSVLGHPLLEFLTKDKVEQEIRGFVREHFQMSINDSNRVGIAKAWNRQVAGEDLTAEDWACLKQVDICPEQQQQLISKLREKYGDQFTPFVKQIEKAFRLEGNNDAHIVNFGHLQIEQFFVEKRGCGEFGFFAKNESLRDDGRSPLCPFGAVSPGGGDELRNRTLL